MPSLSISTISPLLGLAGGLFCGTCIADDHRPSIFELSLKELLSISVVSGAAGFEQTLIEAPAAVSVVTREEWQAMGAQSVSDVIRYVSGAHVSQNTLGITGNKISLRGISGSSAQQVKILLDGRSLNYMQDGGLIPGHRIPLSGLKRIEVIKGPGSAIYGADAFGGVINLVSLDAKDKSKFLKANAGNWDTGSMAFEYGTEHADLSWHVSGEYQTSMGDPGRIIDSDQQSIFDSIFETDASQAPGSFSSQYEIFTLNTQIDWRNLEIDYFHFDNQNAALRAGVAQALDTKGRANYTQDIIGLSYELTDRLGLPGRFTAHYDFHMQKGNTLFYIFPEETVLPIGTDGNIDFINTEGMVYFPDGLIGTPGNEGKKQAVSTLHLFEKGNHYFRWELGTEHTNFKAHERKNFGPGVIDGSQDVIDGTLTDVTDTEYVYIPEQTRDVYFLSVQDEWKIKKNLQFTLGVRYDKFSDFGDTTNPRASLIWNANSWLNIKTFAGTAFRAPSFVDLYSKNNPAVLGSPDLKPETIDTYELAFNFDWLKSYSISTNINFYQYVATDIIQFITNNDGSQVAHNLGDQNGKGLELELLWRPLTQLDIKANTSKLFSEDINGDTILFEAHSLANLSLYWNIHEYLSVFTGFRFVGDRYRAATDTRTKPVENYLLTDSKLTFKNALYGGDLSLALTNVFDQDAKDPSNGSIANDYPLAGRQFLLEFAIEFK